jgi:galactokinase
LETAFGFAFKEAFGIELPPEEWARVGQGVENNYLGLKTGLLDQFSSIFGRQHALILSDFRTVEVLKTVPLPDDCMIVVVNSMQKHNLVDSEYNVRRADCESAAAKLAKIYPGVTALRDVSVAQLEEAKAHLEDREYRRAAHVVGECFRVKQAADLLKKGDVAAFGRLLFESHESSRCNFENSTAELDEIIDIARRDPDCLGARLSGGGFGGITIHLVKSENAAAYAERVRAEYARRTAVNAEIFICSLGQGAESTMLNQPVLEK